MLQNRCTFAQLVLYCSESLLRRWWTCLTTDVLQSLKMHWLYISGSVSHSPHSPWSSLLNLLHSQAFQHPGSSWLESCIGGWSTSSIFIQPPELYNGEAKRWIRGGGYTVSFCSRQCPSYKQCTIPPRQSPCHHIKTVKTALPICRRASSQAQHAP